MAEVFDRYIDTAGNLHFTDTDTGHHVIRKDQTDESKSETYNPPKMKGWICPVCGRGVSPFMAACPCGNGKGWDITCWSERG